LGSFGLRGDDVLRPLPSLSGGQRVRAAFAELAAAEPHLLILDEPTNHLDVYSVDAMVEALRAFEGAVVLVTHDRHVMGAVAEELVVVSKKTKSVRKHEGTVDEYLARFDASPDAGRAP
jgi:ATPase subunit of ABC transporter with duplicated ATPase domains